MEFAVNLTPFAFPLVVIALLAMALLLLVLAIRKVRPMAGLVSIRQRLGNLFLAAHDYLLMNKPDTDGIPPEEPLVGWVNDYPEAGPVRTANGTGDREPGRIGGAAQPWGKASAPHQGGNEVPGATDLKATGRMAAESAGTEESIPATDASAPGAVPVKALTFEDTSALGHPPRCGEAELPPRGSHRPIAWLRAVRGIGLDLLLTSDEILIGRSSECDVVIHRETVSRRHCMLRFRSGKWFIQSFDTPNGTFVNDAPVSPGNFVQLGVQDVIGIGKDVALRLAAPQDAQVPLRLQVGAATARGGRERNEDHYLVGDRLIGVADGVGGRPDGGLASKLAIDMLRAAPEELALSEYVLAIHTALQSRGQRDPAAENMATTLDAARLLEREGRYLMSGIHIGDGIALLDDGIRLRLLTTAHTLGEYLSSQDNPASKHHPDRSRLLRALGMNKNADVDSWDERAVVGHRYVLSTDGLINALGMDRFGECLVQARGRDPQEVADLLVDAGLREGHTKTVDNLAIVVADIVNMLNHSIRDETRNSGVNRQMLTPLPARSPGRAD